MIDRKIYFLDDHVMLVDALVETVASKMEDLEVKAFHNGRDLLSAIRKDPPSLVFLDVELREMCGMECAQEIRIHHPSLKFAFYTFHDEPELVLHLIGMGACAVLSKESSLAQLEDCIISIHKAGVYYNKLTSEALKIGYLKMHNEPHMQINKLSIRELEIILLICKELTSNQIADRIHLSKKTVDNHRANILKKIGAKTSIGIVKYAYKKRMIVPDLS